MVMRPSDGRPQKNDGLCCCIPSLHEWIRKGVDTEVEMGWISLVIVFLGRPPNSQSGWATHTHSGLNTLRTSLGV